VTTTASASPPFRLPASHFAVGLVFLVLGAMGLVMASRALSLGAYLDPRVTSVTHLFTLGWITTSIMGALYQFLPVALGHPVRWPGLAPATLAMYAPGLLLMVAGMWRGTGSWAAFGGGLVGAGTLLFAVNLSGTLRVASTRDVTWWALAFATGFLIVTVVLGATLSMNLRWWFLGTDRLTAIGVHLHVAVVGWVLLVAVGVARRLLPMFLLSHGADERPVAWAVGLLASGTTTLLLLHHAPAGPWKRMPALLITAGMAAFLTQAALYYRHRHRRALDPGMRFAAGGLFLVGAGAVAGGARALTDTPVQHLTVVSAVAVILGLSAFVAAHYYKIVPFLVFYHRYGPLVGRHPVPLVADLYAGWAASTAGWLVTLGAGAVVLGTLVGNAMVTGSGAYLFLGGAVVVSVQMIFLYRRHPEWES